jgi:ribosome biogenesis GTPase A
MKRPNDPSGPKEALFNWYPGHMAKALREIKEKLKFVDAVLEIRDARAPLASGNRNLTEAIGQKRKLIVLNKSNLVPDDMLALWKEWFEEQGEPFLFVNGLDKVAIRKAVSLARKLVEDNRKECNPDYVENKTKLRMMIVGLPNTGKSTIINQLASRNATKVADKPGLTVMQQWIAIDNDVELLDTPGVMPPRIDNPEHGLWLSAIHAIPDDISGEDDTAFFLVKHLLKTKSLAFKERYKLSSFDLSPDEAFFEMAKLRGCLKQGGVPDLPRVHKLLLQDFRKGELGKTCFGLPPKKK